MKPLKVAMSEIPELAAPPFATVTDLVAAHATRRPRQVALICGGRSLDYADLDTGVDRIASTLQRDGVRAGDVVAICATNSIEYVLAFLGALRAGAVVAPLPQSTTPAALAAMIADTGARHLFLDAGVAGALQSERAAIAARMIALDGAGAGLALREWLETGGAKPVAVSIAPEAPFNIIYSSGTTGVPKGIVQPHAMRWTHVHRSARYGYGPDAVTLISTPLHSNTTLVSFLPALALGGSVVVMPKFEAGRYLELAELHRVTHTMLVPVQ